MNDDTDENNLNNQMHNLIIPIVGKFRATDQFKRMITVLLRYCSKILEILQTFSCRQRQENNMTTNGIRQKFKVIKIKQTIDRRAALEIIFSIKIKACACIHIDLAWGLTFVSLLGRFCCCLLKRSRLLS